MRAERLACPGENRLGKWFALAVELQQPGYVHHPVVHLPALGLPRDRPGEALKQRVGAGEPTRQHIDPRAVREP
jgi:hypothetical protein